MRDREAAERQVNLADLAGSDDEADPEPVLDACTEFDHDWSWSDKGQGEEALELAQNKAAK